MLFQVGDIRSDDQLWRASQWDDREQLDRRLHHDCELDIFLARLVRLRTFLKENKSRVCNNHEIRVMAASTHYVWSIYVDPALSRSGGTLESTAVVLFECPDHACTARFIDHEWKLLSGIQIGDIEDCDFADEFLETYSDSDEGQQQWEAENESIEDTPIESLLDEDDLELVQLTDTSDIPALEVAEEESTSSVRALKLSIEDLEVQLREREEGIAELNRKIKFLEGEVEYFKSKAKGSK